ncbi:lipase [Capsulimonas corticalis]|uniref:Lipase n=2 Tax=Capsulimonas corticalis TaxID=2219043 RepID=A0A402D5E0_9BACT|nr:SGNH/GDSL hydrolase family protein [Capsulimonas corticalis]BDI29885.1 lipase [Capsulimonas corticalis]
MRSESNNTMRLTKNSKLVMIGDSITDAGRAQPDGEGLGDALGHGYVALVDALLGATYPYHPIRIINKGTGGNTVRDLKRRWQADVIDLKPDFVSIMIGINDVWRQFDSPKQVDSHVYIEEYEATLNDLIARTKSAGATVILMTPFYIESNRDDAMRAQMDRYGEVVKRLALTHDSILVDTQAGFDSILSHIYSATLCWDRVHPSKTGHMAIARAFLNALDFEW